LKELKTRFLELPLKKYIAAFFARPENGGGESGRAQSSHPGRDGGRGKHEKTGRNASPRRSAN